MNENTEQTENCKAEGRNENRSKDFARSVFLRLFRIVLFLLFTALFFPPILLSKGDAAPKETKGPATKRTETEWAPQSSGVLSKLSGIFFVDRNHGWVVGSNGTLLVTDDGGAKWRRRTLPERQKNEAVNDVWCFTLNRGLLLGEYGMYNRRAVNDWSERIFLLRSGDRGVSWETGALARLPFKPIDNPTSGQESGRTESAAGRNPRGGSGMLKPGQRPSDPFLLRMAFADDHVGWAVGELGTIQYTNDGGATWEMQESPVRKLLYDVAVLDAKKAFAVGAGGTILRTVDGGQNWREQSSGVTQTLRAVHFSDAKRGWAVGSEGAIIMTMDGGARWLRQSSNVTLNLNDIFFVGARASGRDGQAGQTDQTSQTIWIAGDRGLLLRTTDGGATWEEVELSTHANLSRLFFVAPDCGWVVGASGAIFKFGQIPSPQN